MLSSLPEDSDDIRTTFSPPAKLGALLWAGGLGQLRQALQCRAGGGAPPRQPQTRGL